MRYYFAADVHLGLPVGDARTREHSFVQWLDEIKNDATEIFLLGDIFDFWCDYKTVVPRGFVRTLSKLAEIVDSGIPVHFLIGNHDLWMTDYLQTEIGLIVHHSPLEITLGNQNLFLAHGDYLDANRNFIRRIFSNPVLQVCFRAIHPRWGIRLAQKWSQYSRRSKIVNPFAGEEEFLVQFARLHNQTHSVNQFIFGHRHTPVQYSIDAKTQLTIVGEWTTECEYAVFDRETVTLKKTGHLTPERDP